MTGTAELLRRYTKGLSRIKPPSLLYHYTSGAGLLGILDTKTIWATSLRYLNDAREGQLAVALAEKCLDERQASAASKYVRALYAVLKAALTQAARTNVFVTSFSEHGDLLSQWRGYTPDRQGYSLGFKATALSMAARDEQTRHLAACIYDPTNSGKLISRIVEGIVAEAERDRVFDSQNTQRVHKAAFHTFTNLLSLAAATIKASAFEEEAEWRLIGTGAPFAEPDRYRLGASTFVPYNAFRLASKTQLVKLSEIIVSPTPHPDLSRDATRELLGSYRMASTVVRNSSVPYRTW